LKNRSIIDDDSSNCVSRYYNNNVDDDNNNNNDDVDEDDVNDNNNSNNNNVIIVVVVDDDDDDYNYHTLSVDISSLLLIKSILISVIIIENNPTLSLSIIVPIGVNIELIISIGRLKGSATL